MSLSDAEVVGELTASGAALADYFLIGEVPCCVNIHGELLAVTGDEEVMMAMVDYLRRIRVPKYPSDEVYWARTGSRGKDGT